MLCRYDSHTLCSAQVRSPTSAPEPGVPTLRVQNMSELRPIPAESERYALPTLLTSCCRFAASVLVIESSSRWLEPWISQYSSWTLRFHHTAGHGVGSSHGPLVAITGPPAREPAATLYSWIQWKLCSRWSGIDRKLFR